MTFFQAILLGIIQGLTEFLPVSSSGHLVLLQHVLGIPEVGLAFDTLLHLGTLAAVVLVYHKRIWQMIRHPLSKQTIYLVIATVPAVIATLLLGDTIDEWFSGAQYLGIGFLLTTVVLLIAGTLQNRPGAKHITLPASVVMGISQAFALLPGLSRSGSTITGGLIGGLDREEAADFSFLMSLPAIAGALVYQGYKLFRGEGEALSQLPWDTVLSGMLVAAVFGYLAIRGMLYVVRKLNLRWFALYTGLLGILVLLDANVWHFFF